MSSRWMSRAAALVSLACCGMALADGTLSRAAEQLRAAYPGVQFAFEGSQVRTIYGVPMTVGMTPQAAAQQFLAAHQQAFGAGVLELTAKPVIFTQNGRFTVYGYSQSIQGMPVEYGQMKVMVLNQPVPRVVYASGRIAAAPAGGFAEAAVSGASAQAAVRRMAQYADLVKWSVATPAIFQGEDNWQAPVRTWKFTGMGAGPTTDRAFTFFVDMSTGLLVHARNDIHATDVQGTLKGMATPGLQADHAGNVPALLPVPGVQMSVQGGANAYSIEDGSFTIPNAGTAPVTVLGNASGGRWVNVNPSGGVPEVSVNLPGQVPGGVPVNAVFNEVPSATSTAQVNVLIHTDRTHDYYTDRAPGFPLTMLVQGNTGVSGTCNAFYNSNGQSINFYNLGGGCNNTAFSTVIAHEYGHFIVNQLGLAQGAFGEGFGDVCGIMSYDTGIVGEFFNVGGGPVRNLITTTQVYPCTGAVHTCGQVLGAFWYRAKENFKTKYGSGPGLANCQDLQVAWAAITDGGNAQGALHPTSAIEVLTVDDNDGNLANGTPNYAELCQSFQLRNITCPAISLLAFSYPNGRPETLTPGQPTTIRVDVAGVSATPVQNSGTMSYKVNNGSFQTVAMTQIAPNQYEAVIPAAACGDGVRYYFSAQSSAGPAVDPASAPTASFGAFAATGFTVTLSDTFETNSGWSGVAPGDNATTGRWNRMDPQPTTGQTGRQAQPGDDVTAIPGVNCWVTDGNAGTSVGAFDVDAGTTTLTSPVLDLSLNPGAKISYWRWYSNTGGDNPNSDTFVIGVSNNNGGTWTTVETVGPGGAQADGQWFKHEFRVADFVSPTSTVLVRFAASDLGLGSIVEAAVDDFTVSKAECGAACYPDCNGDQVLNLGDFGCFQTKFATNDPYADCNSDGTLNLGDFGCFQTKFAVGCP